VADVTDLDLTRGTIRVTGKLGRVRVLPLHPSTSQALADYLQLRTTALPTPKTSALFVSNAGHPPDLQLRSRHLRQARRAGRRVRHLPPLPPPHT
jgi:integrase/recombinase XerD